LSKVSNDRFAGVKIMRRHLLPMWSVLRDWRKLAPAALCLTLAWAPACAQGFQPVPIPAAPAIITGEAPKPAAQAKPAPVVDKPAPSAAGAAPPRLNDVSGRYIILREGGKDVGCMLTLDDKARASNGDLKAQLAPACRDQGIVVFDPVAWRVERGRLVLTARKGHAATFDRQGDGVWWKDPSEGGKPLGVKKI
jgi:hypothetical protein